MPKIRSPLRNRAEQIGFDLALGILRRFSLERAEGFGRRAGSLFRKVAGRRRVLAEKNLARAFPERSPEEIRLLTRRVFEHFGGIAADLLWTLDQPIESILSRIEVVGDDIARTAAASGRGVFFFASHLGNWEMGALAAAHLGLPMTVVTRPLDNPRLEEQLRSLRERNGNKVLPKADSAREILRTLRRGGTVGILGDQHAHPPDAVTAPFFGRPAATTSSLARLADRTEALILPVSAIRTGPGRYRLLFEKPIDVRTLDPVERSVVPLTALLNKITEEMIRKNPEQWLWLHNRWKLD